MSGPEKADSDNQADAADVSVRIARVVRTDGPLHATHHWHCEVWVGSERVEACWCFSRDTAVEEALAALAVADVGGLDWCAHAWTDKPWPVGCPSCRALVHWVASFQWPEEALAYKAKVQLRLAQEAVRPQEATRAA